MCGGRRSGRRGASSSSSNKDSGSVMVKCCRDVWRRGRPESSELHELQRNLVAMRQRSRDLFINWAAYIEE
jgi:hypothetical protein